MTLPEPWSFIVKLFNFAVMVAILVKFAGKPLKNALQSRRNAVKEKVDEADRLLKEAEALKKGYESKLGDLDSEIEAFRKKAMQEAEQEKTKIVGEAQALAERIRQQARLAYDQEMKDAMLAVQAQIARRTLQNAEAAVRQAFKKDDHDKMVDEFIANLQGQKRT
ncbi:MAG TPA: ATP synthase F0 subunit B [Syntrophorhabdales bacterium]|nr:ATP synthase F0 subunit B [Syntrophorhabdales bacterium]